MRQGTCLWFNDSKGYGFLSVEGYTSPIFVHYTAIYRDGFKTLGEGQQVEVEVVEGPKGPQATKVVVNLLAVQS